jgi:hypothetical protein
MIGAVRREPRWVRLELRRKGKRRDKRGTNHRVVPSTLMFTLPDEDLQYQSDAGPGRSSDATHPAAVQSCTPSVAASAFFE